jgi:uncharacterized repeat protein (TIGR01451 family)
MRTLRCRVADEARAWGVALAVVLAIAGGTAPPALASTPAPAWTITSFSGPTNFTPGDSSGRDVYSITATNTGGAPTAGGPIVITDNVPSGVTFDPNGAFYGYDQSGSTQGGEGNTVNCEPGPPVTCTDLQDVHPLQPGESIFMFVPVDTAASLPATVTNNVTVAGGGAAPNAGSEVTPISTAPASFGFHAVEGANTASDGSSVTQAGSHPYQTTVAFRLNNSASPSGYEVPPAGNAKTLTTNLPAGFVVNPQVAGRCTETQLEQKPSACPLAAAVGTVAVTIGAGPFPTGQSSPLYNMVPAPGAPAEFAFDAGSLGDFVHLRGEVRTGRDYGLSASAHEILQYGNVLGASVTLWGNPSDPSHDPQRGQCVLAGGSCRVERTNKAFLTLPSACSNQLTTTISADSWQNPASYIFGEFQSHPPNQSPSAVTGCESLDFSPSIGVQPDTTSADTPAGLNVAIRVPQEGLTNPNGLAEANLKDAVVTLPAGMAVSPSAANGLGACSPEQIGLNNANPASCPDSSKLGTSEIVTPLLEHPLKGAVYLAQQGNNPFGSLLALYLVAEGSGALIKLAGHVEADPTTGRLTASFDQNPQLPFTELKLQLFGGPKAPLVTPPTCGTYETHSALTPWSGTAAVTLSDTFAVTSGCGGGFAPTFSAGTTNNQAGGFSPLAVTLSRQDGEQRLAGVQVKMPAGLLGVLKSVAQCPEPQASQGSCGPQSLIGHTTVAAGPGPDPFYVGGNVFLTGPYKGAPFGLSILVHAVAGPFDLGNVIVRAAINVDPHTAQITVTSDPLPTILSGIPLDLRTVNVTIDRPGFIFNPTNCAPAGVTGAITSTGGAIAPASTRFEAANCANLPFKPVFTASTGGSASKANGASLDVKVSSKGGPQPGGGEANIKSVKVDLPKQLPSRLTTLQKACLAATFETNPADCPKESDVGTAAAVTPVLAHPLSGPAYLVSHGGAAFPDLEIVLQGEGIVLILDGKTDIKKGVTSSTFKTVPDAPISSFALKLPTGKYSILGAYIAKGGYDLCGQTLAMPTAITGQNGAVVKQTTKITVTGCGPSVTITKVKVSGNSLLVTVKTSATGRVRLSGYGLVTKVVNSLKGGVHTITVALTNSGIAMRKHGQKAKVRVSLTVGKQAAAKTTSVKL